jgi:hypothetical protein
MYPVVVVQYTKNTKEHIHKYSRQYTTHKITNTVKQNYELSAHKITNIMFLPNKEPKLE